MMLASSRGKIMIRIELRYACLAVMFALSGAGAAQALTVAHKVYAEKTKLTDISLAYPETGVKAIDGDIRAIIAKKAKEFRSLAKGDYQKGDGVYTDDADYTIARNDGQVFAVAWEVTEDFHGAHPSHEYWTANYLLPDGWRVYLPEIVDGARGLSRISALARSDLDRRLLGGAEPVSDKDWIAKGTAPTAQNFEAFVLMPRALHIQFQSYQVDCYACDDPVEDIPLANLTDVLRKDWRAPQASFACVKASAPIEIAICSDARLARLDRQVGETYFEHIGWSKDGSIGAKVAALKTEQRAWLKSRDTACAGRQTSCLMTLYRARLDALESMTQ
jgi:uncharacterized protein YecT (DUF1311 family)